jgi:hypothetical protein
MTSYILSGFFAMAAGLVVNGNVQPSTLLIALVLLTVSALTASAQMLENRLKKAEYDAAILKAKESHPAFRTNPLDQQDTQVNYKQDEGWK